MSLEEVYADLILDHYKSPRNRGVIINPDRKIDLVNPLCGDQLTLMVKFDDDKVLEVGFTGSGCSISQATASIMSELLLGKSKSDALGIADLFRKMMKSEVDDSQLDPLGDAIALQGVKRHTARIKCALLAWDCAERVLKDEAAGASLRDELK